MNDSDIPTLKFPIPWGASAGPGYIRPIPVDSQIGIQDGAASLTDGFPPLSMTPVGAGGKWPFGQDTNGILNEITAWLQWIQAGAPIGYDSSFSTAIGGYPSGSTLAAAISGGYWFSEVDANSSNPDTGGANWLGFTPLALYAEDTGTKNAIVISVTPNFPSNDFYIGKLLVVRKINTTNDSAVTVNLNGNGADPLIHTDGTAVSSGECAGDGFLLISLDPSGNFQLLSGGDSPSARVSLGANLNLYVATTGSDSNDGLSSLTPFLTMQHAWNVLVKGYDLCGYNVTVNIADGTYAAGITANGRPPGATSSTSILFQSTSGNTAACIVSGTSALFLASDFGEFSIAGFKLITSGPYAIQAQTGKITYNNIDFGAAGNAQIHAQDNGVVFCLGNYKISAGSGAHVKCGFNGVVKVSSATVTISGTPAFSDAFAFAEYGAVLYVDSGTVTFPGTGATGLRYIGDAGVVNSNGGGANFFPGNSAGNLVHGGQYI